MTTKTFTFRYDPDDDVGKWMREQSKKSDSLEAAIRTIIGNYGYEDYNKVAPKQVKLNNANNTTGKDSKTSFCFQQRSLFHRRQKFYCLYLLYC